MRFALVLTVTCVLIAPAFAQQSNTPAWTYPQLTTIAQPPTPLPQALLSEYVPVPQSSPIPTGLPERTVLAVDCDPTALGQQHWVSVNLGIFQPFVGRVGVKVWSRPNNSVWLEAYGGSVLFDAMYGFGIRMQHTVHDFGSSDHLMLSPGIGVHIIPSWYAVEKHRGYDPYYGNYLLLQLRVQHALLSRRRYRHLVAARFQPSLRLRASGSSWESRAG